MLRIYSCLVARNAKKFTSNVQQAMKDDLIEVFINDNSVRVKPNSVIIQACKAAGIDIPRFCYHERLAIAGNCRMCLVQVEKVPKMVASCAQPVSAGMRIFTDSPAVRKAREGVMEFLLANHPLDCPICDQGGECDLQDQAMAFGSDRSRFRLDVQDKRAVEDKYLGPLIKTSMNRCIHCTRCVRFANEIAGVPDLGTSGRGNDMEIGTYVEKTINSELSGNIIDLCPVGALTSKPYAFQARPWELKKTESIDVMDAVGSAIRIDSRGPKVYRVLPRENASLNEEWLSDKARFACDALSLQRLTKPLIKSQQSGLFQESGWGDALNLIASKMNDCKGSIAGIAGDFADAESMYMLKELFKSMDCTNLALDCDNPGTDLSGSNLTNLNYTLNDIEQTDAILLIGSNTRHEAPLLNLRVRKNYLNSDVLIGVIGPKVDLTFEYEHLGQSLSSLLKNKNFLERFKNAKKPIVLIGQHSLLQEANNLKKLLKTLPNVHTPTYNGFGVLNRTASRTAGLELGYGAHVPISSKLIYLLNADNYSRQSKEAFIVYQGHHGDHGASQADVILPGAAYTEKNGIYVNCEGRIQESVAAVPPPGDARADWSILRALSEFCGRRILLDTIDSIRAELRKLEPFSSGKFIKRSENSIIDDLKRLKAPDTGKLITYAINDYYMTDVISKQSPTMAACSREFSGGIKLLE